MWSYSGFLAFHVFDCIVSILTENRKKQVKNGKTKAASEKKTQIGFVLNLVDLKKTLLKIAKTAYSGIFPLEKILKNQLLFDVNHGRMETIK